MKRVVQKDTWSCFACVAAMITGQEVENVFDFVGHDGSGYSEESTHPDKRIGFDWVEIIKYLIEYRFTVGTWSLFDPPFNLHGYDKIQFEIDISDCPAILEVPSDRLGGECTHVVYWDGKNLFDPSPAAKEDPKLSDYKVLKWIPVIRFE